MTNYIRPYDTNALFESDTLGFAIDNPIRVCLIYSALGSSLFKQASMTEIWPGFMFVLFQMDANTVLYEATIPNPSFK
jgi:hypothetical protein